jgi:DNA-binding NtrC family response regulator
MIKKDLSLEINICSTGGIIKTIMIVDDEADIRASVKSYLKSDDIDVVTANDSRQALELMEEDKSFDLILIDTQMPCSDKSALFSMQPKSKFEPSGVDNFLQKPFTKEQLIDFVKEKIEDS